MITILKLILAAALPWLVLLLNDNPGGAVLALVMQASVIGWPFASLWAIRVVQERVAAEKKRSAKSV